MSVTIKMWGTIGLTSVLLAASVCGAAQKSDTPGVNAPPAAKPSISLPSLKHGPLPAKPQAAPPGQATPPKSPGQQTVTPKPKPKPKPKPVPPPAAPKVTKPTAVPGAEPERLPGKITDVPTLPAVITDTAPVVPDQPPAVPGTGKWSLQPVPLGGQRAPSPLGSRETETPQAPAPAAGKPGTVFGKAAREMKERATLGSKVPTPPSVAPPSPDISRPEPTEGDENMPAEPIALHPDVERAVTTREVGSELPSGAPEERVRFAVPSEARTITCEALADSHVSSDSEVRTWASVGVRLVIAPPLTSDSDVTVQFLCDGSALNPPYPIGYMFDPSHNPTEDPSTAYDPTRGATAYFSLEGECEAGSTLTLRFDYLGEVAECRWLVVLTLE